MQPHSFVVFLALFWGCHSADVLFSIVTHRHGARSPAYCFPLDVDPSCTQAVWPDGLGMLTQRGAHSARLFPHFQCMYLHVVLVNYRGTTVESAGKSVETSVRGSVQAGAARLQPGGPLRTLHRLRSYHAISGSVVGRLVSLGRRPRPCPRRYGLQSKRLPLLRPAFPPVPPPSSRLIRGFHSTKDAR
jgi:hypothetical protein